MNQQQKKIKVAQPLVEEKMPVNHSAGYFEAVWKDELEQTLDGIHPTYKMANAIHIARKHSG